MPGVIFLIGYQGLVGTTPKQEPNHRNQQRENDFHEQLHYQSVFATSKRTRVSSKGL
jgi:hypothetical protein